MVAFCTSGVPVGASLNTRPAGTAGTVDAIGADRSAAAADAAVASATTVGAGAGRSCVVAIVSVCNAGADCPCALPAGTTFTTCTAESA